MSVTPEHPGAACESGGTFRNGPACGPDADGAAAPGHPEPKGRRSVCVRCAALTDRPVVVCEVHEATGPGFNVYGCPDCAPHFPPLPGVVTGWEVRS